MADAGKAGKPDALRPADVGKPVQYLSPAQVAQRYSGFKFVGKGTFGKVFRARQQSSGQEVALKYIKLKLHKLKPDMLHELQTLRALAHRCGRCHLVCYKTHYLTTLAANHKPDAGKIENWASAQLYLVIVMQFVAGGDLADQAKRITAAQAARVARQLFEAVKCLHGLGYAHRDIKPANVLFHGGRVVLADYGLSCLKRTCTGRPGTPAYMWERILDTRQNDLALDTYKSGDLYGAAKTVLRLLQGPGVERKTPQLDGPSKSPKLSALMRRVMKSPTKFTAQSVLRQLAGLPKN